MLHKNKLTQKKSSSAACIDKNDFYTWVISLVIMGAILGTIITMAIVKG